MGIASLGQRGLSLSDVNVGTNITSQSAAAAAQPAGFGRARRGLPCGAGPLGRREQDGGGARRDSARLEAFSFDGFCGRGQARPGQARPDRKTVITRVQL